MTKKIASGIAPPPLTTLQLPSSNASDTAYFTPKQPRWAEITTCLPSTATLSPKCQVFSLVRVFLLVLLGAGAILYTPYPCSLPNHRSHTAPASHPTEPTWADISTLSLSLWVSVHGIWSAWYLICCHNTVCLSRHEGVQPVPHLQQTDNRSLGCICWYIFEKMKGVSVPHLQQTYKRSLGCICFVIFEKMKGVSVPHLQQTDNRSLGCIGFHIFEKI